MELNVSNPSDILREGDVLKLDFDSAVVQILKCNSQLLEILVQAKQA